MSFVGVVSPSHADDRQVVEVAENKLAEMTLTEQKKSKSGLKGGGNLDGKWWKVGNTIERDGNLICEFLR